MIKLSKKHEDFNMVWWLLQAKAKKEIGIRKALECLHVKNGIAESTNGHFALRGKTSLEDGLYEVVEKTKTEIWLSQAQDGLTFPNINAVIPDIAEMSEVPRKNGWHENKFEVVTNIIRTLPEDLTINFDYVETILHDLNGQAWCEFILHNGLVPVVFSGPERMAVIMPMRHEKPAA